MKKSDFSKINEKYGVFFIVLIEILFFSFLSKHFFSLENLLTVSRQLSFIGIAAVGGTFLIISGGIDISTGSMLAFSGVFCCLLMVNFHLPIALAILITLLGGFGLGMVNGIAYTKFNISPLIATLSLQTILKGVAYLITKAKPIYGIPNEFKFLGQGYIFGIIPFPIVVMIAAFIFGFWLLNFTYLGRYIYAIGGNDEAARLSGIKNKKVSILAFASSGLFASIAGVLMAARLGSGQPNIGGDFPMEVITAIVLGGVSINGGRGKITGVIVGAFIMGILGNGMIMIGLSDYLQWVVKGIVLFFAVALSNLKKA